MPVELKRCVRVLRRWAWLLVLSTALAAGISLVASSRVPRTYSAMTTLMVGQALQNANPQAGDFQTSERLAQTYAQLVRRQPVLQATVESLQLSSSWEGLASQVAAIALPNTQLVQITVIDRSPQQAVVIADELAQQLIRLSPTPQDKQGEQRRQFVDQQMQGLKAKITDAEAQIKSLEDRVALQNNARDIQDLQGQISALQQQVATWQASYATLLRNQEGSTNNLSVVDPASSTGVAISPNTPLNVLVAAGIGLALAVLAVLLLEYLDDSIRTKEEVERLLKIPCLGAISRVRKRQLIGHPGLAARDVSSPLAEAYRALRTQLQFLGMSHPTGVLLVTSGAPGEGKTTIACNLGITLAQAGRRVIVCDADLRRPTVHHVFGVSNEAGLSTLLSDPTMPLEWALQHGPMPGLWVLPSGPLPPSPPDLLSAPGMKERIVEMEDVAEVIILDAPALLPVVDAAILAGLCTGAVLVVDSGRTRSEALRRVKPLLDHAGLHAVGAVLNNARDPMPRGYSAYYSRRRARQPGGQAAGAFAD